MKITINNQSEIAELFARCDNRANEASFKAIKYLDLGVVIVRVICKTPEVISHIERQMTYVLRDEAPHFDATIVVWKEDNLETFVKSLGSQFDPRRNIKLRVGMICSKGKYPSFELSDGESASPFGYVTADPKAFEAYDRESKTVYYSVENFELEEFIRLGHALVQPINYILKDAKANIAHGAVIGYNNNGILFCARGQRGKSTLTVHAMMNGFEYVSDDYQILNRRDNETFASPIYSIITLSPTMYSELYDNLKGKFISNNGRKDKYVINIADYHDQFRVNYPIRLCILPEIVSKPDTEFYPCSSQEKGRAIVQLIQSTVSQMRDMCNKKIIRKMLEMVKDLPFYKVDLCRNIAANTENLRKFLEKYDFKNPVVVEPPKIMADITFDIANILDCDSATIYTMNTFATNIYENLLMRRSAEDVRNELAEKNLFDAKFFEEFELFVKVIAEKGFLSAKGVGESATSINWALAKKCMCKLLLIEYSLDEPKNLINII